MRQAEHSAALQAELPWSERSRDDAHPASQKTGPRVVAKNTYQAPLEARPLAANTMSEEKRLAGQSNANDGNDEAADADRRANDAGECDDAAMPVDDDEDATMKNDDASSDDAEMHADGDEEELITDDAMQTDGDEIIDEVHDDANGRCADS